MFFTNLLASIGGTPLVGLRLDTAPDVTACAKLELANPFGMKDRVAKHIITTARRSGELAPDAPIVESSSGTMALGLALVGTQLGHQVHIVTDPRIDAITRAKLLTLGCEVHVVPTMTGQGWQSARLERLAELRDTLPGAFWPSQYSNPGNPGAYRQLANELITDLGGVDVLVGAVGSGGSLCGTSRALREFGLEPRVVAVDCVGSILFGQPDRPKRLQSGLGNSLIPGNLDYELIDEVHWLNDREAFTGTAELAQEQAIFAGNTSGSVYTVLRHLAAEATPGTRLVGIFPDRGDRYAETVYDERYLTAHDLDRQSRSAVPGAVEYGTTVDSWSVAQLSERKDQVDAVLAPIH